MTDDAKTAGLDQAGLTRRRVLTRLGVGGAIVWTTPVLTSALTPAAAESDGGGGGGGGGGDLGLNLVDNPDGSYGEFDPDDFGSWVIEAGDLDQVQVDGAWRFVAAASSSLTRMTQDIALDSYIADIDTGNAEVVFQADGQGATGETSEVRIVFLDTDGDPLGTETIALPIPSATFAGGSPFVVPTGTRTIRLEVEFNAATADQWITNIFLGEPEIP